MTAAIAVYIDPWLRIMKGDRKAIFTAAKW